MAGCIPGQSFQNELPLTAEERIKLDKFAKSNEYKLIGAAMLGGNIGMSSGVVCVASAGPVGLVALHPIIVPAAVSVGTFLLVTSAVYGLQHLLESLEEKWAKKGT